MLEKKLNDNTIFLRVDPDEEVISAIEEVCKKYDLNAGKIEGIGTLKNAVLGYYTGKEYEKIEMEEDVELISCIGDISTDGEKYVVHLHAALSDDGGDSIAGHLFEGIVSFTGEFFITFFPERLKRVYDPETELKLIE